jgi:hypothetical protein
MSAVSTFCNVAVSTVFDVHAARSSVWVINSGLRTRASKLSGLLMLPCDAGLISMCLNDVPVPASLASDLVLGLDWLHSAPELVVHLSDGSLDLRKFLSTSALASFPGAWPPSLSPLSRTYFFSSSHPASCTGCTREHWCGALTLISVHGWTWCSTHPLIDSPCARYRCCSSLCARNPDALYARNPNISYARWNAPHAGCSNC